MADINYDLLQSEIKEAAKKAFTAVRAEHPNEHFYAFALYSDDGAMTVEPAANTQEGMERKAKEYGYNPIPPWFPWLIGEWAYEGEGGENFLKVYELLETEEDFDEDDSEEFEALRTRVFESMIRALEDLEKEHFFGAGSAREAITLFCSISDSDDAGQLENESARRLNPPSVYEKFLNRLESGGGPVTTA
ncbi:MAG: DUF4303 domain-containing protein [Armatimonadota bacterium]|nr:DUF4303 domain-containing protein [Armatimonadota bacterium]